MLKRIAGTFISLKISLLMFFLFLTSSGLLAQEKYVNMVGMNLYLGMPKAQIVSNINRDMFTFLEMGFTSDITLYTKDYQTILGWVHFDNKDRTIRIDREWNIYNTQHGDNKAFNDLFDIIKNIGQNNLKAVIGISEQSDPTGRHGTIEIKLPNKEITINIFQLNVQITESFIAKESQGVKQ